jgi:predicted ester cyclase
VAPADLSALYLEYIACLNRQDWAALGRFVDDEVSHNGRQIGLSGYREMLERDFREIPDLQFNVALLVAEPPRVASRLDFACTPKASFLGLPVNGKRVSFAENVFYEFRGRKIWRVWSVIDKAAIEAQL